MKRLIYVDFENVSTSGLNGLLKLDEKDHVKIFLGPKCSKLSLIEAESILHCNAAVELITNDQIAKNALDFIIMVHLGYDIAKKSAKAYYIISQDKGYEPAIKEMQSMTGETIERLVNIQEVISRNDVSGGFLSSIFGKKKAVVENQTEHEVFEKGKSKRTTANGKKAPNGQKNEKGNYPNRKNDRNPNRNNNNPNGKNKPANGPKNGPKQNNQNNQNNPKTSHTQKDAKPVNEPKLVNGPKSTDTPVTHSVTRSTSDPKPVSKPIAAPKPLVDEAKMDNLSVADIVKEMNRDGKTAGKEMSRDAKPDAKSKAPKEVEDKKNAPLSAEEKAMVERLMKESLTKEEFHNKLMSEIRDNDRATEIYKVKRAHFNQLVRERENQMKKETENTPE